MSDDWRLLVPKQNMSIKDIAKIFKVMELRVNFEKVKVPKEIQKYFKKDVKKLTATDIAIKRYCGKS